MSILNNAERTMLDAGLARHDAIEALHKAGTEDAKKLQRLVGQRCKKNGTEYEITSVNYSYTGFIKAYGYRILKSGKRGTRRGWDIGNIMAGHFDDA